MYVLYQVPTFCVKLSTIDILAEDSVEDSSSGSGIYGNGVTVIPSKAAGRTEEVGGIRGFLTGTVVGTLGLACICPCLATHTISGLYIDHRPQLHEMATRAGSPGMGTRIRCPDSGLGEVVREDPELSW